VLSNVLVDLGFLELACCAGLGYVLKMYRFCFVGVKFI
jgi:hypothetical protein